MNTLKVAVKDPNGEFVLLGEIENYALLGNTSKTIKIVGDADEFGNEDVQISILDTEVSLLVEEKEDIVLYSEDNSEAFLCEGLNPLKILSITHPPRPFIWINQETFMAELVPINSVKFKS